MSVVRRDLKIDKRVVKQLSESAIKKDPVQALVELITNSDDSYRRLESHGLTTTGNIVVEVVRKHKNSIFSLIDQAEGFDDQTMDERVGGFGTNTSGLTKGLNVRGFFGRGLKEAILGLGNGSVSSVRDGYQYICSLNEEAFYEREDAVKLNKELKKKLADEFGIDKNGTVITISVTKDGVNIPQIDNLTYQLARYFSLRDITSSKKRSVYLIEKDEKGRSKKNPIRLEYQIPLGKEVLNKKGISLENYSSAEVDLQIFKATDLLTQDGPCREGGILIKGKTAIHDVTLFGYEDNPYAQKIFGYVKCKYIDELMKKEEPILSDRRDGLDWHHPLCKALRDVVTKELKPIVDEIKREEESQKKLVENEKTRQRFLTAIEKINQIALQELGAEGEGRSKEKEGKPSTPPPNGFDFIPEYYQIIAGNRATLTLKVVVPWVIPSGSIINVETDSDDIRIENKIFTVKEEEAVDGVVVLNPKIYGKRVGTEAIITARTKDFKAEALIKVVAAIDKKNKHKERKGKTKEGLFNDIKYDPALGPKVRHYFDKEASIIKISSKHPSVEVYLGPNGEGQDALHCQVLVAELVTDAVCRELARRKAETGRLPILGEYMDAVNREHYRLINEYAHIIHQYLVAPEGRRKK
ncbi:MAG: hypothetical protein C4581_02380 [Nitrospiraceae bacterium]|nr:MAG: hypothetical protein C4581_02380 [Nitrospiraceae bacterium]